MGEKREDGGYSPTAAKREVTTGRDLPSVASQRFRRPLGRVRHEAGCNAEAPFSEGARAVPLIREDPAAFLISITQRLQ